MADYRDQLYDYIDSQFDKLGGGKDYFSGLPIVGPTEYEGNAGAPVGWVSNASGGSGVATVVVDANGITITNGALTLSDQFGNNVITGGGFGASWLDFIASGFYNGNFSVGTTNNITAATIVGTASTTADYAASLSSDIPYWIVNSETGAGTLKRVADSTAVGGFALQWDGTETAEIFQDIPVVPGSKYSIGVSWRYTLSTASFNWTATLQFRKADHSAIGSTLVAGPNTLSTTLAAYGVLDVIDGDPVPADARYLRVFFKIARVSGSPTVWLNSLFASQVHHYGTQIIRQGAQLWIEDFGQDGWGVIGSGHTGSGATTSLDLNISAPITYSAQGSKAYRTTTQTIATATDTNIVFDSSEDFDLLAEHSLASNQSRFTVARDGVYLLVASVAWDSNTTGTRLQGWLINGTGDALRDNVMTPSAIANRTTVAVVAVMTAGDYAELRVRQDSGANRTCTASGSVIYIGLSF